jgi:hypothetical protein
MQGGTEKSTRRESQHDTATGDAAGSHCRALVLVSKAFSPLPPRRRRPCPTFLAQLIATAQNAPQTRERRRAEPAEALSCYAAKTATARAGATLVRSL